jgi:hypothetical protein
MLLTDVAIWCHEEASCLPARLPTSVSEQGGDAGSNFCADHPRQGASPDRCRPLTPSLGADVSDCRHPLV